MDLRLLTASDAPAYRALRLRALREWPEAFTSSHEEDEGKPLAWYEQRLSADAGFFLGAFAGGQLCGVVGLERDQRAKTRHRGKVVGMYVATEHGAQGMGRALVDALLARARDAGLALLVLTVTAGNARAQALYEAAGFRSFGVEPGAIRVGGRSFDKNHMFLELR